MMGPKTGKENDDGAMDDAAPIVSVVTTFARNAS